MENVTADKARLYENIEGGLSLAGTLIDRCEAYEGEMSAARAVVGKALASLEILRAEMVENRKEALEMEHNYLSQMGLGIVTAGLAIIMVQSYCTISSFVLGIVLLATGVAAVIIGGIWCREESERNLVEE